MADDKKFKMSVNTENVKKAFAELKSGIGKIGDDIKNSLEKPLQTVGKVGSAALKGIGNVGSKAFKGIGTAIKGAGIGLLIGTLASLWEALKKNQKIMDLISNAINTMSIFIKPLIDGVASMVEKFQANNDLLEKMKGIIGNLITVALTPLKISFYSIQAGIQAAMLAWEKSFLGGKDPEKIKQLTEDLNETKEALKEVAVTAVDAGKDFAANIGTVVKGVTNVVKETVQEVKTAYKNMDVDATLAQAKAATQAKKDLERLSREQEKIVKIAEIAAEKQRGLRDDDTKTFEERIKANEELSKTLEQQAKDEIDNINKRIEAQKLINSIEGETEEGKNAILDLNNAILDVEKRITGQEREQQSNANALRKEQEAYTAEIKKQEEEEKQKALNEAKNIAKNKVDISKYALDQIKNDEFALYEDKIKILKDYYDKSIELAELNGEDTTLLRKEQLQAENDLYNEHLSKKQNQALEGIAYINNLDEQATQFRSNLLANQLKSGKINQEDYDKSIKEIEIKAAKRKKAYAIAETIVNTAASIMGIWKDVPKVDYGISAGIISGAVGLLGAAQIATIASTPIDGAGGSIPSGSIPEGGANAAQAPSTSFTFDEVKPQQAPAPVVKTYVVSSDIRTQDQLDRKIIGNGTI
jgi:hypothetical protein